MKVSNTEVYLYIAFLHVLYLFIGLSTFGLQSMIFFYLFLIDGAFIGAYLIFKDKFVSMLALDNLNMMSIGVGIIIAGMLVVIELGFYGAFSYTIPYSTYQTLRGVIYLMFVTFVVGNSEEIFFRGFLPAIANKYAVNDMDLKLSNYVLSPSLFAISHYFAWSSSIFGTALSFSIYMFLYHFVFGVTMQYLRDYYNSLYSPIASHTIYDAIKILISL